MTSVKWGQAGNSSMEHDSAGRDEGRGRPGRPKVGIPDFELFISFPLAVWRKMISQMEIVIWLIFSRSAVWRKMIS